MAPRDRPPGRNGGDGPTTRRGRPPTPTAAKRRESAASVTADGDGGTAARRELEAWAAAVEHLHALDLPAAVPEFPARWLARRGVRADWTVAS
jgi:hypothetical protein